MEFGFWQVTCAILIPGVLWASWIDYAQRRVPNWLNASLIALGFIVQGSAC
jgi:Flp pilus assembly protein protease CpaA